MSHSTQIPPVNKDEWAQAANSAKEAAASMGEMTSHAASAVGAMASQAASHVGRKADDIAASAGLGIQELGERISDSGPHAGVLGNAAQAVARTVKGGGEYLEHARFSGLTEDVAHLIRRYPVPAVLVGIGFGYYLHRLLKR